MKIAVTTSAHDVRDPRIHLRIALGLADRGYDVQLLGGFNDTSDHSLFSERVASRIEWFELTGMNTEDSSLATSSKFQKANTRLKRFREIKHLWETQLPDLIIIMDPELAPMAQKWASKHNRGWILDLHEDGFDPYYPKNRLVKQLIKYAFNNAHGVIWAFEPRNHHSGLLQKNRSVIAQNYFPFTLYNAYKPNEDPSELSKPLKEGNSSSVRLLYTGIIGKERGLHHMVRLIAEFRKQQMNINAIIAGRCYQPGYLKRLQELISSLGVEKYVHLIGGNRFMDWFELQELHVDASYGYLIYPSDVLQWYRPTKVYEYAAHKIPILASGITEFKSLLDAYPIGHITDSPTLKDWNPDITESVKKNMGGASIPPQTFESFNRQHTWQSQLDHIEELIYRIGWRPK